MTPLNNNKRLDNPKNIVENDGPNETMNVKKTPWFLRWPGAILRKLGMLASKAPSLGSAILQPIRQRLNHWNWRKKTALVTALAITATVTFVYQYQGNAAWQTVIPTHLFTDFLVNVGANYVSSRGFKKKITKKPTRIPMDGFTLTASITNAIMMSTNRVRQQRTTALPPTHCTTKPTTLAASIPERDHPNSNEDKSLTT